MLVGCGWDKAKQSTRLKSLNGPLVTKHSRNWTHISPFLPDVLLRAHKNDNNCVILRCEKATAEIESEKRKINNFYDSLKCTNETWRELFRLQFHLWFENEWLNVSQPTPERGRKGKIIFIAFILFALLQNNKQKCFMDARWALQNRWCQEIYFCVSFLRMHTKESFHRRSYFILKLKINLKTLSQLDFDSFKRKARG